MRVLAAITLLAGASALVPPPQQLRTPHVTLAHLERAMLATRPSVGPEDLHRFEEFTRLYGAGN